MMGREEVSATQNQHGTTNHDDIPRKLSTRVCPASPVSGHALALALSRMGNHEIQLYLIKLHSGYSMSGIDVSSGGWSHSASVNADKKVRGRHR